MTVTIPALGCAMKGLYIELEDGRIAEFKFSGWVNTEPEPEPEPVAAPVEVAAPEVAKIAEPLPEVEKPKRKYRRKAKAAPVEVAPVAALTTDECASSDASNDDAPASASPAKTEKESTWDKNTMLVPLDKCLGVCDYDGKKGKKRYAIYRVEYKDGNIKGFNLFFITKTGKAMGLPNYKSYGPTHGFYAKAAKVSNITWHDAVS